MSRRSIINLILLAFLISFLIGTVEAKEYWVNGKNVLVFCC